jgi:hypothetical protein
MTPFEMALSRSTPRLTTPSHHTRPCGSTAARRLARFAALLLLALCGVMVGPCTAAAGTYDVYGCQVSLHKVVPTSGWSSVTSPWPSAWVSHYCSRYGLFGGYLSAGAVPAGTYARWQFDAPADTSIANYTLYRYARSQGGPSWVKGYELFEDVVSSDHVVERCLTRTVRCDWLGKPVAAFGPDTFWPQNRVYRAGLDAHHIYAVAECLAATGCPSTASQAGFAIMSTRVALRDDIRPVFTSDPTGGLVREDRALTGVVPADFAAVDRGSGIYRARMIIDGRGYESQVVDGNAGRCARPFTHVTPCSFAVSSRVVFNTARVADGAHVARIEVIDAAGNPTRSRPYLVTTLNHPAPNGLGASRGARLSAHFSSRAPHAALQRAIRVRYGDGSRLVVGRLLSQSGSPIVGASLRVLSRTRRPGGAFHEVGKVATDARGRFAYRPGRGPSRDLRFAYRAFSLDAADAAVCNLRLLVRAGLRLSATPRRLRNGQRVLFRGRLLGGPGRAGTIVALQALAPRALTFKTVRADRLGRFHATYRFRYTFQPTRYRFRALLQAQAAYPYLAAASPVVTVRVRP